MDAGIQQNSINSDWADELVQAFSPYPEFVTAVTDSLATLVDGDRTAFAQLDSANATIQVLQNQIEALEARARDSESRLTLELSREPSVVQAPAVRESTRVLRSPSKTLPDQKILVIDEAELGRVLLSRSFRGLPVKLEFAKNLESASELCSKNTYDWMLVDFGLATSASGASIGELQARIGAQARMAALSSKGASTGEAESAREFGFTHYLSRTLERDAFRDSVLNSIWG